MKFQSSALRLCPAAIRFYTARFRGTTSTESTEVSITSFRAPPSSRMFSGGLHRETLVFQKRLAAVTSTKSPSDSTLRALSPQTSTTTPSLMDRPALSAHLPLPHGQAISAQARHFPKHPR